MVKLSELLGLADDLAHKVWVRLVRVGLILIAILFLGFVINYFGGKEFNLFLSLIMFIATLIVFSNPMNILAGLGLGVILGLAKGDSPGLQLTGKALEVYYKLVANLILWQSVIFFILGTISFEANPKAFFGIIGAFLILSFTSSQWGLGVTFAKRFIFLYTASMLLVFSVTLIPGVVWVKWIGYDIPSIFGISETEKVVRQLDEQIKRNLDEAQAERLRVLLKKVERKETLSTSEEEELRNIKRTLDRQSMPAKSKETLGKLVESGGQKMGGSSVFKDLPYWVIAIPAGLILLLFLGIMLGKNKAVPVVTPASLPVSTTSRGNDFLSAIIVLVLIGILVGLLFFTFTRLDWNPKPTPAAVFTPKTSPPVVYAPEPASPVAKTPAQPAVTNSGDRIVEPEGIPGRKKGGYRYKTDNQGDLLVFTPEGWPRLSLKDIPDLVCGRYVYRSNANKFFDRTGREVIPPPGTYCEDK